MAEFANLNPDHIILLLTKNPAWYRFATWPDNVWCGFTATNNDEYFTRLDEVSGCSSVTNIWVSLEPWLSEQAPAIQSSTSWLVIGGRSGPNAKPVSRATRDWLCDKSIQARRFTKRNVGWGGGESVHKFPHEYPAEWKV